MAHINKKRPHTRLEIIKYAAKRFVEKGYTATSIKEIAEGLDISPGNITFYFHSKEHLLSVLVDALFDFQKMTMEKEAKEGVSSLLSYCLELTVMAAASEESDVARDLYISAYVSPLTLEIIRFNDTEKTKAVFAEFCEGWSDDEWRATENIVSGIEFATLMKSKENIPLEKRIEKVLDSIMLLYGVPEEIRKRKIEKVLALDYRTLGKTILADFRAYIEKVNEENLKNADRAKKK